VLRGLAPIVVTLLTTARPLETLGVVIILCTFSEIVPVLLEVIPN